MIRTGTRGVHRTFSALVGGATAFVKPEDVGEQLGCGPDVEEHVEKIRPFIDAGFDEVALVQIGAGSQDTFIAWAQEKLLPALRSP